MEQKEQAEFTELLQKYSSMVLRIAFSNVKNLQDAQDIAQEVFISVLTKRPQFDSEEHEKAWLIRVTINRCKNHVKSFWNRHTEGLSEDLQLSAPRRKPALCRRSWLCHKIIEM